MLVVGWLQILVILPSESGNLRKATRVIIFLLQTAGLCPVKIHVEAGVLNMMYLEMGPWGDY